MDCGLDDDKMVGSQMENDQQKQRNEILETLKAPIKCLSGDNINEKMKTDSIIQSRRQSLPMDVSRKLFHDDSSKFTQSERLGPHCAVLYYRHKDTDSEQDVGNVSDKMGKRSMDESSEDEWVYTYGADNAEQEACNNGSSSESRSVAHTVESFKPSVQQNECEILRTTKKEDIQRLINQAEELVREEVSSSPRKIQARLFADTLRFNDSKGKISRVKEWLSVQEQDPDDKAIVDSCDASCECTTEDDDLERHSSDDLNTSSVATCHHSAEAIESGDLDATLVPDKSFPSPALPNMPEHTKVVMRQKRKDGPQIRPWSVSGMSQLGASVSSRLSHFSISESALHQLAQNSTPSSKMESSVQGTLSSSTVEETTVLAQDGSGGGYSSNSLRRRKVKLRKRNLGRKSESGSDGVLAMEPGSPLKNGPSRQPISGTETEEETEESNKARLVRKKLLNVPAFRLGPALGAVTVFKTEKVVSADSSFSEQAWDNYQEKYMSEAYSEEAADPEAARRLLDFGDDYRNFLDSQSDCASSFGRPFYRRRPTTGDSSVLDSDSDIEDVCKLFDQSHSQYVFLEQVFTRQLSKASPQLILASDFADIIARCKDNVLCLRVLLENVSKMNDNLLSPQGCQEIRLLIDRWETLEGRAENLQRMRTLQREMSAFRDELLDLSNRVNSLKQDLDDQDQLERRIQQIKVELAGLRDRKAQLLQVNVAVHRFLTDTGHPAGGSLKEDVNDLYRIWDETHQRASQQLSSFQQLSAAWQQFELHLTELQVALRGDHETLRMLDSALQGGSVSPDVATSVRDVAKVLSEKQEMRCESAMVLNDSTSVILTTQGVSTMEASGSLSDSGISDSGSEQELSEREKRLATLRRLARHLEAILAPGSQAITDMAKRIEQTELELRGLQQTCRELIVRTAVCAEAKVARKTSPPDIPPHCTVSNASRQRTLSSSRRKKANSRKDFLGVGDPDDPDPGKPHSWLWRVMRAALPFQMAIMALFCVACLLEPHCCDSINNLNFSLSPQLRYIDGPPPV